MADPRNFENFQIDGAHTKFKVFKVGVSAPAGARNFENFENFEIDGAPTRFNVFIVGPSALGPNPGGCISQRVLTRIGAALLVFSTSPGVPRLADSYTPMELCTTGPLGTWLSFQSVRRRLPAPAGGRADRSIGPLVGKRWFRVLSSCRRPSSGPLWFFGPPAASPSRAFLDPPPRKRPTV